MIDYEDHEKMKARLRAEGIAEGKMDDAAKMLEKGYAPEEVSSITGLSLEEIKDIPAQKKTI